MKFLAICLFFCYSIFSYASAQKITVSENQRHFVNESGEPFFWLGDTAWELFHKLSREEATEYLENRSKKGFTVIQAVVLAENDGLRSPNAYGHLPFKNLDPTKPNEAYFEHVDFIVEKAASLGLIVGMLPTWGDKVFSVNPGAGPVIFDPVNAGIFGEFLGRRYKNSPIVWILGGDRNVANDEVFNTWQAMAKGIKHGDKGNHLITYHPRGASTSARFFHNETWLDFNMYQSGHERPFNNVYKYAEDLVFYKPRKPFVEGEPAYEDIPVKFWNYLDFSKSYQDRVPVGVLSESGIIKNKSFFKEGFFTAYDVRVFAYWNLLAGAAGYTYGNNAIWQMFKKGESFAIPALTDWREAMDRPGAEDMKHVRDLFESRPFNKLLPDQSIIYGLNADGKNHIRSAGSTDQSYAMIYLAVGQQVKVVMQKVKGVMVNGWWYNPRTGEENSIGPVKNIGIQTFKPPSSGEGKDWILVLDQQNAGYKTPGK